jgi:hypothetical protein
LLARLQPQASDVVALRLKQHLALFELLPRVGDVAPRDFNFFGYFVKDFDETRQVFGRVTYVLVDAGVAFVELLVDLFDDTIAFFGVFSRRIVKEVLDYVDEFSSWSATTINAAT